MGDHTRQTARNGAVRHAREALAAEDMAEKNYHLKEAIQLLDADAHANAGR